MEYEYEVLKRYADKRNGLKIARNLLINSVSILEFMNNTYNPIDFQLEGWAEHTQVEIDNYDNVLEELWEKYKMTGRRFSPEIRLILCQHQQQHIILLKVILKIHHLNKQLKIIQVC